MRAPGLPLALVLLCALPLGASPAPRKVLMIVTSAAKMPSGHPTGLWLEEFAVPYNAFREAGFEVVVASPRGGPAPIDPRSQGDMKAEWTDAAARLEETRPLAGLSAGDFVAVFLPGGHGTMFDFPGNRELAGLLEAFSRSGKPLAAVCHGPAALVDVRGPDGKPLVAGRTVTGFTDSEERAVQLDQEMPFLLETRLRAQGARFEAAPDFQPHVEADGSLVTGQNPSSSLPAVQAVLRLLQP